MITRFAPEAERREFTPLDNLFITEYLRDADGDAVKVYLHGLMRCYHASFRDAAIADELGLTAEAVTRAFVYWQSRGLVRIISDDPLTVEYLSVLQPSVTMATPVKYRSFVTALSALLAPREPVMRELKVLYDCIELYGLDESAVLELVGYCVELKGKRVSVNYVASVAQSWAEQGITSAAAAKEYIDNERVKRHGASDILRRWNKRRAPTQDEMELYEHWVRDWGFDGETILAVCPQLTSSANPSFEILNERLGELFAQHKTCMEDVAALLTEKSDEREFARLVFARMGKLEPPTRTNIAQIAVYVNEKGLPRELVLLAADNCTGADKPFGLLKTMLKGWADAGIRDVAAAEAELAKRKATRSAVRRTPSYGYAQNSVSDADFDSMIVNLDEDV